MFANLFVVVAFATRVDWMTETSPVHRFSVINVWKFGIIWANEFQTKIKMTKIVMSWLMISIWIIAGPVNSLGKFLLWFNTVSELRSQRRSNSMHHYSPYRLVCIWLSDSFFRKELFIFRWISKWRTGSNWILLIKSFYFFTSFHVKEFEKGLEGGKCEAAQAGTTIYKDCNITCNDDECNNNNDVELLFSHLNENGQPVEIRYFRVSEIWL